ncbi:murein L,D-transpeptidase catalytic domain family protein [Sphingomonas pseudosanguinis]|uniref:Transcriptional initiation protein Tat n=1 Tax=Sphingomonas pseudosanguinis TaxID=413712 RepID=A0A7W6A617_9SPHN|nr:murein L,D-transpeptidase catalytic domain family protein [Sphingomonas pseudosanguinis]MBB3877817.1 hypothetical protein [Sphingomonas pseudosanguinis]MBN3537692.1 murein L,D-transpeptidase catalytic domain family protein [Sphingomonas pseudosanguinis]
MLENLDAAPGRRALLKNALVLAGALAVPGAVNARQRLTGRDLQPMRQPPLPNHPTMPNPVEVASRPVMASPRVVRPALFREAMAALQKHGSRVHQRDRMAIVDFAVGSSEPRLHLIDLVSGKSQSLLVSHGSGSDPSHSGYLQRFSNAFNSNASSEGAFLTDNYYVGKHGRSQRLIGLDPTNDNALGRAIVIHSAWYANRDMIKTHGMLGRSQGCFAVGENDLDRVFANLGPGRMIYAAKV